MNTVLVIGDLHIKVSNLPEIDAFLNAIDEIVFNKDSKCPDMIVLLGDVLDGHERLHSMALNKAVEVVKYFAGHTPTFVLVGNHDFYNNGIFLSEDHWMNCLKDIPNVTVVDKVIQKNNFVFVPYVQPGRFMEALSGLFPLTDIECGNSSSTPSAIFAHQEFKGSTFGAFVSEVGDDWGCASSFPFVVSGHIHRNQMLWDGNVYYPGSAIQHAFGESERNVVALITFDEDAKHCIQEIDLKLPQKKIIYVDVEDITEAYVEKLVGGPSTPSLIKIVIRGTALEIATFRCSKVYRRLVTMKYKLALRPTEHDPPPTYDDVVGDMGGIGRIGAMLHDPPQIIKPFRQVMHDLIIREDDPALLDLFNSITSSSS